MINKNIRDLQIQQAILYRYSKNIDIEINEDQKSFKFKNNSIDHLEWVKNKLKSNPQGIDLVYGINKTAKLMLENNKIVLIF